ncbi:MAG: tRNA lysidine(34) synthetase TilS [Alphaproteobacteria bacterium]|nr:tRNA lysidine(34) synthetase TilS [Alphaproteobacteria bacterium]
MTEALDAAVMARLMARFEPFEPRPVLAVGVSGGADSLALVLLADLWARERSGRVLALTVDHGLRRESAGEAHQVGSWLATRGIAYEIVTWRGPKPSSGVQAAAREARLCLLADRCRKAGILHLMLAHHRGDQAETVALRREDASGPDGLAAMPAETPAGWGRVLRPLLAQPKTKLTDFLSALGQPWIEDPSNRDEQHARVRLRHRISAEATESTLACAARDDGNRRAQREAAVAGALARHVVLHDAGWASIARDFVTLPDDIARRGLSRTIVTIGNLDYPPRGERLDRLLAYLRDDRRGARTLGDCRIVSTKDGWLVARESRSLPPDASFAGNTAAWDRFLVVLPEDMPPRDLHVGAMGSGPRPPGLPAVPGGIRPSLAVIRDLDGVVAVPHLGWVRPGADVRLKGAVAWTFPRQALASAEFAVA